jgi:hypothetical protein
VVVSGGKVVGGNRTSIVTGSHISAAEAGAGLTLRRYSPVISANATTSAAVRLPYIAFNLNGRFGTVDMWGTFDNP